MHKICRLRPHHVNIRLRLVLWYLISLGFLLLFFASFLHRRMDYSLLKNTDAALELAATQALDYVDEEDGRLVFRDTDALRRVAKEFDLHLIAPDGAVWDDLSYDDAPYIPSPEAGYTTLGSRPRFGDKRWRVYSQQVTAPGGATIGWLQVAQSLDDTQATLKNLTGHMCFSFPLMLVLAIVGSFFLTARALRPIDQITRTAQGINASDLEGRINYAGADDEVGRLARTFDSMLDRLQAGFERERRFTSDAAHELRTPLTALKGGIGVTLSQPRQPAEYENALRDMENQVDRLIRLSNDMLFLARLDHEGRQEALNEIALSDLLAALLDQVRPLAEAKSIELTESVPPDLVVNGNMDLLIRLFLNLLDNAIKYTPFEGQVKVEAEQRADSMCVHISDTGPGIPPGQLPHLFERFYRAESDRTRRQGQHLQAQGGAGLGLAIAQEIAHAHGGDLTAQSQVGQGSTFTFCMPKG
jgi:heavy metal sensor kinase